MTLIFQDTFTEAVNTPLENHTPDLGSGWLVIYDTASTVNILVKPIGHSPTENVVGPSGSENSAGWAFAIQPSPSTADVTLVFDRYMQNWEVTNSYGTGVFARHSESGGSHTFYGLRMVPNLHSQASLRLYKVVNNSGTLLGEYDHTFQSGDVITFECYDSLKRVLVNGVERITSADNEIGGPGNAGIWWGTFTSAMGTTHLRGEMEYSFFQVDAPAAGGTVSLDATAAGGAVIGAGLDVTRELFVVIDPTAVVTASLGIVRGFAAGVAGEAAVEASLDVTHTLSAAVAGETAVTATLEVLGQVDLAVNVAGSAEVAASLAALRGLVAAADGETVVSAGLVVLSFADLAAAVSGEAVVSASLAVLQLGAAGDVRMWFEVPSQAALAGDLVADVRMTGEPLTAAAVTFESVA